MKIIHFPYCYYPDPAGGTEAYVRSLALEQRRSSLEVVVAAPALDGTSYQHEGISVVRFRTSRSPGDLRQLYGDGDPVAAADCVGILEDERPDIVHMHAFTPAVSLRIVRAARSRGLPVVLTYHTATISCQRGTLMEHGTTVCDGAVDVTRCTSCVLGGLGVGRPASEVLGRIPSAIGSWLGNAGASGGPWTALRMTELMALRISAFHALMNEVNRVMTMCEWSRALLVRNGVPPSKIVLSRHGIDQGPLRAPGEASAHDEVRLAYFGRLERAKGIEIVLDALRRYPSLHVSFDIFGIAQGDDGAAYRDRLKRGSASDSRVAFHDAVPREEIVRRMSAYDAIVVPSQCLETGPLVVLESFAAGVPVIGSRLGGIAELIDDGVNGVLVQPGSADEWGRAFERLVSNRDHLRRLRHRIPPPRRMAEVASELTQVYETVLHEACVPADPVRAKAPQEVTIGRM